MEKGPQYEKIYKERETSNTNMPPGDLNRLPDDCIILIDGGFLSKLSKYFGGGKYLIYDLYNFAKNLASK